MPAVIRRAPMPVPTPTLSDLRRYAVARTFGRPTGLLAAVRRLGFVQADPIRAPARAQDLILRHRVAGYRAGDLERAYRRLPIEEDAFVNYGYLPRETAALMHPRSARRAWSADEERRARDVLAFVRERGTVHPREVDAHFAHGRVRNWFGGTSAASTQLLDAMHYRGLLRVERRASGTRTYAPAARPDHVIEPVDGLSRLLDVAVRHYAPLPRRTLGYLAARLAFGAPQWAAQRRAALQRTMATLASTSIDGQAWYWPADEDPASRRWTPRPRVRLLAPFDPVVWDRHRFALLWGWEYRFEAYTPAARRQLGYYALPLLWRDRVVGWANVAVDGDALRCAIGYDGGRPPADAGYAPALADELAALARFLHLPGEAVRIVGPAR